MKSKLALPLFLLMLIGFTVACQRKASGTAMDMTADKARKELTKGTWMLSNLDGGNVMLGSDQKMPSLTFTEDGRVSGYSGCNPLAGTYTLEDGLRLRFNDIAVGLSSCPSAEVERSFLDAVNTTDNFTIGKDILSFNVARRASLATLTRSK